MSRSRTAQRRADTWLSAWVTAALLAGSCALAPWIILALSREDVEALETPLLLSVARQLEEGPSRLYGPYGVRYPLVLIHAPLYYRLAALAAWPFVSAGFDSISAARVAGRLLSSFGFLATLGASFGLGRLGRSNARAGLWSALLVSAIPVYGGLQFEVRPDMIAVALQTTGILLVLSAIGDESIGLIKLTMAFGFLALALCTKQQFVVVPMVSVLVLLCAWARGRLGSVPILGCVSLMLVVVLVYYGTEQRVTGGRMGQSCFEAAARISGVHPADWQAAGSFFLVLAWKCVGLILLLTAAGLAIVSARVGPVWRVVVVLSKLLIALVVALTVLQLVVVSARVSELIVLGLILVSAFVLPAWTIFRRSQFMGWIDAALCAYGAGEAALAAILCRLSTGAWFNYGIQAVVIGCVLTGRALDRACESSSWRRLIPAALAALAVPVFAWTDAKEVVAKRRAQRAHVSALLQSVRRPAAELFFVDRPGDNRMNGRFDLVYDPWLYPVFESMGLAEPRSLWLERALTDGSVRVIAAASIEPRIEGLRRTLPELGYRTAGRVGPYRVWLREDGSPN
jgi:hypothetical protein